MICEVCKGTVEEGRQRIGHHTCLICGDRLARLAIETKRNQVAPAYSKGPLMFLGGSNTRQAMLDAGRKTSGGLNDFVAAGARPVKRTIPSKRRIVGTAWDSENRSFALFEGDDPKSRGAVRHCYFLSER